MYLKIHIKITIHMLTYVNIFRIIHNYPFIDCYFTNFASNMFSYISLN